MLAGENAIHARSLLHGGCRCPIPRTPINSSLSRSTARSCRSTLGAAGRCWWSTPLPSAATPRNIAISRPCGSAIATAVSSCSACRPTISARRSRGPRRRSRNSARPNTRSTFHWPRNAGSIGGNAHPFYRWVADSLGEGGTPRWNFHKYLIAPEGELAGAWPSQVAPSDPRIAGEIDRLLPPES